jgi:PEP-CTERM motif
MNKIIITLTAITGMTAAAFAQGSINVDNSSVGGGLSRGATQAAGQGLYFSGNYTLQVWFLNAASVPINITSDAHLTTTGAAAYANLATDGFTLANSYVNKNITALNAGVFSLASLNIAGVSPKGGNTVIALAAWANNLAGTGTPGANFGGIGGVFAFINPTSDYTALPTPTPAFLTGWTGVNDLVMVPVPEPATLALAGLGSLASLVMLRRKQV